MGRSVTLSVLFLGKNDWGLGIVEGDLGRVLSVDTRRKLREGLPEISFRKVPNRKVIQITTNVYSLFYGFRQSSIFSRETG